MRAWKGYKPPSERETDTGPLACNLFFCPPFFSPFVSFHFLQSLCREAPCPSTRKRRRRRHRTIRSPNASSPSISTVEAVEESQSHDYTSNPRGALDSGIASSVRKPVITLNVAAQSQVHLDSAIVVEALRPAGPCARNRVPSCSRAASKVRLSTEAFALVDLNSKFVSANRPSSAVVIVRYYCGFLAVMMWMLL